MNTTNPKFEYRTTFAKVPDDFPNHTCLPEQLSRISPKPPRGEDWQLVCSTTAGGTIFYFWERPTEAG